jgi:MFS family permease
MIKHHVLSSLKPFRRASLLRLTLINMGLLDELLSGFTIIGLPLLRQQLGLSYEQIGLLFSVAAIAGLVIEPAMFLLSDRGLKRWWILGGLFGLALTDILAGSIPTFPILLIAFFLSYPASGAAISLSQVALIESAPHENARTMTRWTMLSSIGDLLSPLAVTTILAAGLGWSGLRWISAACWLVVAFIILPQRFPRPGIAYSHKNTGDNVAARGPRSSDSAHGEESRKYHEPSMSVLQGLRQGLRDTILLRWAALDVLTTMLDEIFLTFAILYLRDVLRASAPMIGLIVAFQVIAGFLGLLALDRLLKRVAPLRLLVIASWLALSGIVGLLVVHVLWFAALSLFLMGLGSACLYPIVAAQAYNRQPGRSGTVRAIIQLGQTFDIALPGIAGLIAGQFGPLASLGFLGIAPVLFLVLAPRKTA